MAGTLSDFISCLRFIQADKIMRRKRYETLGSIVRVDGRPVGNRSEQNEKSGKEKGLASRERW